MNGIKQKIFVFVLGLVVTFLAGILTLDSKEINKAYCESVLEGK